ncbi:MAG: hypothetical protein IKJ36_00570 [Clostridia bacterium]|nr:hypothetical protein [Clostridia bacterium]
MRINITKICLIIFVLLFSVKVEAVTKPSFYIKDVTKYSNSNKVVIEIYSENISKNITSWSLDVKYDSKKLEFLNSKAGKDLSATFKLAENVSQESKVSMGAINITGFDKEGLYYQVSFKVLDDSTDIPVELVAKEVCDKDGNDVSCSVKSGKIIIPKEEKIKTETKTETKKEINDFEVTEIEQLESIENILINSANMKFDIEDDLVYETEHIDILEIMDDGTMIPKSNGITTVRIKNNYQLIGTVEIEVKDEKIIRVTKVENNNKFLPEATTSEEQTIEEVVEEYKKEIAKVEKAERDKLLISFCIIVLILITMTVILRIYLIIRKRNKGGRL